MANQSENIVPPPKATARGEEAKLHPLVILNISDHWTRTKAQLGKNKTSKPVYGALLGKHEGRLLEIINSFELRVYEKDGLNAINEEFLRQREAQFKEVFPEMDLIGWYATGELGITENDQVIQNKFTDFVESPVIIKLEPGSAEASSKLPICLWESAGADRVNKAIPWLLVSEESERIGVDHVTRLSTMSGLQNKESEAAKQVRSNNSAVSMLVSRVQMIHTYLVQVLNQELPLNDTIVREANKLCQLVARLKPDDYNQAFNTQESDVYGAVLLSKMTDMCGALGQLVCKVNLVYSEKAVVPIPTKKTSSSSTFGKDFFPAVQASASGSQPDLFNF